MVKQMDLSSGRIEAFVNMPQGVFDPAQRHYHPHFELLYIVRGVRALELNGQRYKAPAGTLLVFRPGDEHVEFAGTRKVSLFVLRFMPQELVGAKIAFPKLDADGPLLKLPHRQEFLDIFTRMLEENESSDPESKTLLGAYLIEFVVKLRRAIKEALGPECQDRDSIRSRIVAAADLMQQNLSQALSLNDVAQRAFMSSSHFSHSFKERLGESPKRYQIRKRMEKAKELLARTSIPASDIAKKLGYRSPYFFYRQFKRKTGITPSEYRTKSNR
ncbi:MAG: hypothetical protein A2X49_13880 [Lentisphaerae bacterium GWF2_52_8]|nr:MAG: hypothetical protein A2X49_13880 [Lentisphaerae bacterium GWF2_52_8]